MTSKPGSRLYPAKEVVGDLPTAPLASSMKADQVNLMIASIAKNHNASIATRNIKDFTGCGITLINPWEKRKSGKN